MKHPVTKLPVTFRDLLEAFMDVCGAITLACLLILGAFAAAKLMWP